MQRVAIRSGRGQSFSRSLGRRSGLMDAVGGAVLGCLAAVTGALVYYLRCHLPHMIEERTRDSYRAFSRAVELRFPNHEGLTSRVIPLSLAVGRRLGLQPRRLRNLELAAQL